jgi:hypothetical protein
MDYSNYYLYVPKYTEILGLLEDDLSKLKKSKKIIGDIDKIVKKYDSAKFIRYKRSINYLEEKNRGLFIFIVEENVNGFKFSKLFIPANEVLLKSYSQDFKSNFQDCEELDNTMPFYK